MERLSARGSRKGVRTIPSRNSQESEASGVEDSSSSDEEVQRTTAVRPTRQRMSPRKLGGRERERLSGSREYQSSDDGDESTVEARPKRQRISPRKRGGGGEPARRNRSRVIQSSDDDEESSADESSEPEEKQKATTVSPYSRSRRGRKISAASELTGDDWQELCRIYEEEFEGTQAGFLRSPASGGIRCNDYNERKFSGQLKIYREMRKAHTTSQLTDDDWQELCRVYEEEFEGTQAGFLRSPASGSTIFNDYNERKFSGQLKIYRERRRNAANSTRGSHARRMRTLNQKQPAQSSDESVGTGSEKDDDMSSGQSAPVNKEKKSRRNEAKDRKVATEHNRRGRARRKTDSSGDEDNKADAEMKNSDDEQDSSSSSEEISDSDDSCQAKILKRGRNLPDLLEFSVRPIQHLFTCSLCNGLYREPYTITRQCLHTFCKSCLVLNMSFQEEQLEMKEAHYSCPECQEYLGNDWRKHALPDPALQHLMDKVLFRDMAAKDEEEETLFNESRGIKRKLEKPREENTATTHSMHQARIVKTEQIMLVPAAAEVAKSSDLSEQSPPALDKPFLEVPGNIRVGQLKKYLAMKIPPPSLLGRVFCNEALLGNEWTVEFIKRTMWMPEASDESPVLTLHYR